MKTTMKKKPSTPVAASPSPRIAPSKNIFTERLKSAAPPDTEEECLTPEELTFHLALSAENGFSMEAALERLLQKKHAK
ncbi:hypothetical protein [Massilia genomosp. 1]|uniref:Uncharacterized protein n=1 Tax=Massilia genomosp. 1 TaxID=2609280 RepID=A0ABX0MDN1_9BURK|nr:hypothetical protein [Massilia genomosp. 1]NHZ60914.1 hypothetical protein [Massilia genomosp. 1]